MLTVLITSEATGAAVREPLPIGRPIRRQLATRLGLTAEYHRHAASLVRVRGCTHSRP